MLAGEPLRTRDKAPRARARLSKLCLRNVPVKASTAKDEGGRVICYNVAHTSLMYCCAI